MLIVTIEGLVWICTINGILNQLGGGGVKNTKVGGELRLLLQL